MPLPSFLGPLQSIPPLAVAAFASPAGGAGAAGGQTASLQFSMQSQMETNWCWAATTASVSRFFDSQSSWSQCNVANACLANDCCASPDPCNVEYVLDIPLTQTGNLQGAAFGGTDTRAALQAEIDAGRPVCCHISWDGGGGHFVAVSGYDWSTDDVFVNDPLYGSDTVPFDKFATSYRDSGTWDFTYHTQR
jgi:hypothetical protein